MKLFITSASLALLLNSCALITTPVKVVGTIATTSIKTTGKVVGAGIDLAASDGDEEAPQPAAEQ